VKIREQLPPARRRVVNISAVVITLLLWFMVTLPVLPASTVAPLAGALIEQAASSGEGLAGADASAPDSNPAASAVQADPGHRPLVPASVLPSPLKVIAALGYLHREQTLVRSAVVSFLRITVAFFLAALVAIPLGIVMGTYPPVKAAIEPLSGPLRYLPVSAITGLFILLLGIGEEMKITFLFVGVVVYLLPIVIETVENVDQVFLDTASTLGAKPWQVVLKVIVPAAWPGVFEACRVIYGIGWTYVILAELINAKYGLGYLITISYRRGHIDWAYALVLVVLLLGVGTNELFRITAKHLFAWKEA
jgi:NitT/TauT family transport system permease protein